MKLKELIRNSEYVSLKGPWNINITNVTTDMNKITESTLFVFIKSERFDINTIKFDVINKKPIAIVCDFDFEIENPGGTLIKVEDSRVLLPFLYYRIYNIQFP